MLRSVKQMLNNVKTIFHHLLNFFVNFGFELFNIEKHYYVKCINNLDATNTTY